MKWLILLTTTLAALAPAVWFQIYPMRQANFFFGVRVPAGFPESPEGRRTLREFRLLVWLGCLVAAALLVAGLATRSVGLVVGMAIAQMLGLLLPFWRVHRRVSPHAAPLGGVVREASIGSDGVGPAPFWAAAAPLAALTLLAASAITVSFHWDRLPDPMPLHYGLDGQPDRWGPKTWASVLGILPCALATQALLAFLIFAIQHSGSWTPRRRLNLVALAASSVAVAFTMAAILFLPLLRSLGMATGGFWLVPVIAPVVALVGLSAKLQRSFETEEEPTRDDCWSGGIWYADREDSRLMVPNRINAGYAPNFGHPVMRVAFPLLIGVVVAGSLAPIFWQ